MHKTILLITLLFVCFGNSFALSDVEKKYYEGLEKQNQKLTEQVESQQKEINYLKLHQSHLEDLVVNEPARLDKRIDDATKIFSVRLDFAIFFLGIIGLIITVSGIFFSILSININKTNKSIILKQKEYDKKLKNLNSKADIIDKRLEEQKEKLPPRDEDIKSYTRKDFQNLEEYLRLLRREKAEKDYTYEEWFYVGLYHQNGEQFDNAIKAYDEALKINPNLLEAWYNKGLALGKLGKHEDAIKTYDEALKIEPNDHEVWLNNGVALGKLGKFEDAVKAFDEALKIKPNYHEAWNGKAWNLMLDGDLSTALKFVDKAIEIKNDDYNSQDTKATILMKKGELDKALKWSKNAIDLMPKDATNKKDVEKTHKQILEAIAAKEKEKEV